MLKPNTRFLRHIIKDTDSHNNRLLAKEAADSQARLKDLEKAEEAKRLRSNPDSRDIRRRQMGDIHAILGGKKRQRTGDDNGSSSGAGDSKKSDMKDRDGRRRNLSRDRDLFRDREGRKQHGRLTEDGDRHGSHRHSDGTARRRRRHGSADSDDGAERRRHRRRDHDRSRSPTHRRRLRSPDSRKHRHRHRSPIRDVGESRPRQREGDAEEDDSDPLDDFGPMPAPKPRGRGALAGSSGIDRRFSETYDPKMDVRMDEGDTGSGPGGDWDDAVEAFRDRQKLRQNQVQRLRSAGFSDDEIQKMDRGGKSPSQDDVRWSKEGEKREWDLDKAAADEEHEL